jgi:hypothetical protein
MKFLSAVMAAVFWIGAWATAHTPQVLADEEQSLARAEHALFVPDRSSVKSFVILDDNLLDPDFSWTDSYGITRNKSEIVRAFKSGKGLPLEARSASGEPTTHIEGQIAVVQENVGKLYVLRVWVKREGSWQLLVYQAVSSGAPPSASSGMEKCENPCNSVPFDPQSEDQREVIQAYQAVERAVAAHDSAAWGAHIAGEFFAVTSNSDRPLNKAARMAGLDNQKVAGIAPFPLVSARMFEFADAMVMISLQQPQHGLPLHVTRVWFKRNGVWLEAYSYQTTIQAVKSAH